VHVSVLYILLCCIYFSTVHIFLLYIFSTLYIYLLHIFLYRTYFSGAWGSVVVKALRYWSEGLGIDPQCCHWGLFPRLTTEPYALGLTQPLKMSTRKIPGSKAGRCIRLTTCHLLVPNVKKIRGLNLPDLPLACSGLSRDSFNLHISLLYRFLYSIYFSTVLFIYCMYFSDIYIFLLYKCI
jgi:hypothetical protein